MLKPASRTPIGALILGEVLSKAPHMPKGAPTCNVVHPASTKGSICRFPVAYIGARRRHTWHGMPLSTWQMCLMPQILLHVSVLGPCMTAATPQLPLGLGLEKPLALVIPTSTGCAGAFSILPCKRDGADMFTTDDRLKVLTFTGSPAVRAQQRALELACVSRAAAAASLRSTCDSCTCAALAWCCNAFMGPSYSLSLLWVYFVVRRGLSTWASCSQCMCHHGAVLEGFIAAKQMR